MVKHLTGHSRERERQRERDRERERERERELRRERDRDKIDHIKEYQCSFHAVPVIVFW